MYVRMLTGLFKGQIRDIAPEAALAMLLDGRVQRVYPEDFAAEKNAALENAPPTPVAAAAVVAPASSTIEPQPPAGAMARRRSAARRK
jgi:hypothetical protein